MTSRPVMSRWVWLAFAASVLLFGGVWCVAHRAPMKRSADEVEVAALGAERSRLQGNDDRIRDGLREQQRGISRIAWTPAALAALQQRQGTSWGWTWAPGEPSSRVTLQRVAPRIEEWPAYRAFVAELSAQPGVIVESVELLAEGTARDRRFTRVAIGLRFIVAVASAGDGQRAAPSRVPPTVAPAGSPATSRKAGLSTARRRPSAFAEPSASGTVGAAFRLRPSEAWGRPGPLTGDGTQPAVQRYRYGGPLSAEGAPFGDGQRAAPSRVPPTVAPALIPAAARSAEVSTPYRRPSASAKPPAAGTVGTPFRPRPSGSHGRLDPLRGDDTQRPVSGDDPVALNAADAPLRDGRRGAPGRVPPTVASAGPAASRKAGTSTSHRRPYASAEPPAHGTTGAAFRPRPSGLQGRFCPHCNQPA
jgi:hypothetical protein